MNERISALMDGELDERSANEAIERCGCEAAARETWTMYHLIGDAMRESRVLSGTFTTRFAARLDGEPTVLAPAPLAGTPRQRFVLAAAASVAAVALVGWLAFAPQPQPPLAKQQEAAPALAAAHAAPITSAANDYLLAHQGFSPRMSLQGMAPYVRTVAAERDETAQ